MGYLEAGIGFKKHVRTRSCVIATADAHRAETDATTGRLTCCGHFKHSGLTHTGRIRCDVQYLSSTGRDNALLLGGGGACRCQRPKRTR